MIWIREFRVWFEVFGLKREFMLVSRVCISFGKDSGVAFMANHI